MSSSQDVGEALTIGPDQEREFTLLAPGFQEMKYLLRRADPLQHLTVQFLLLHLLNTDLPLHAHFRAAVVPASTTTRDEIRYTGTFLRESLRLHVVAEEHLSEFHHFEESDAHDGCFGVVAPAETGDESRGDGDNVFESAPERDAGNVGDHLDVEIGAVEESLDDVVVDWWEVGRGYDQFDFRGLAFGIFVFVDSCEVKLRGRWSRALGGCSFWSRIAAVHWGRIVGDGGFGEFLLSDFVGDVGARKCTAVDS